jgi:hypothetical protein
MASLRRIGLATGLGLLLTLAILRMVSSGTPAVALQSINSGQHFLPPYGGARDRIGFDSGSLSGYDVTQLHAGWYTNWGANLAPAHPDQLVYVQTLQLTAGADPHDPDQVTVVPNKAIMAQIAAAHPGSLWLLGNEPDSIYQGNPILPEVYAVLYNDYYAYIKGLDPAALIGNGGIVQPTPCRLEYLDIVHNTYLETFDEPMPVDVWNIHAFILREVYGEWGASTPVGVDPSCGIDYPVNAADDIELLLDNITAMRTWMQERGYQDKPLIISEYGILWPTWFAPQFTAARVSHFMTRTFDLFLGARDLNVGYPSDDHRLVQAWAWYSLSDDDQYNGYLFYRDSKTLSPMGEVYGAYTAAISDSLYTDLSAKLVASRPSFTSTYSEATALGPLTFTVSLSGNIANLGKRPASGVGARFEAVVDGSEPVLLDQQMGLAVPGRFEGVTALPPLTAALTAPGRHVLRLAVDHDGLVDEPRVWNNVTTRTVAILPDLTLFDLVHEVTGFVPETRNLVLTATVRNQGTWSSPAASSTAHLAAWPDDPPVQMQAVSIPTLTIGAKASAVMHFDLSASVFDLYRLILSVDEDGRVPELDEGNNETESMVPITVRAIVTPTSTVVLTSASGAISLVFPPGAVSTPTEVLYTPLWPADWNTGVLKTSSVAFSLAGVVDGGLMPLTFSRPISVFWRYDDAELDVPDEGQLRLFAGVEDGVWRDAACQPYLRGTEENWLEAPICHTGQFVFGYRYDKHWPVIFRAGFPGRLYEASPRSEPFNIGSPLLLP